jgi:tRNA threonylcarbamoyladenosine modification (KEOPS) complex Cgi121 subunit
MAEPERIEELGIYVSSLKIPQVPENWPELLAELRSESAKGWVQIVNAAAVAGLPHILFSVFNAVSAFRQGYNKLAQLEAELLLVLSGTDRFQKALEVAGAKIGKPGVVIIISSNSDACKLAVERIGSRITGIVDISDPTLEEAREVAKLQGLDISAIESMGDGVKVILAALVERGSLLYS